MNEHHDMIRIDEEELERAIAIALSVTRDMYLRFAVKGDPKFQRKQGQEVITYAVMRQLSRYAFFREPSAFELAEGRLGVLPLFPDQPAFPDQDETSGSSSSG
jgi:hypothetical protein